MTATISPKANSLAIERMREMDEQERLERICTKQKRGTPIVRKTKYLLLNDNTIVGNTQKIHFG